MDCFCSKSKWNSSFSEKKRVEEQIKRERSQLRNERGSKRNRDRDALAERLRVQESYVNFEEEVYVEPIVEENEELNPEQNGEVGLGRGITITDEVIREAQNLKEADERWTCIIDSHETCVARQNTASWRLLFNFCFFSVGHPFSQTIQKKTEVLVFWFLNIEMIHVNDVWNLKFTFFLQWSLIDSLLSSLSQLYVWESDRKSCLYWLWKMYLQTLCW